MRCGPSPRHGVDDLLAAIEAESGGRVADAPAGWPPPAQTRARSRRLMLVAAAAGIVVVAGLVGIVVRSADDGRQTSRWPAPSSRPRRPPSPPSRKRDRASPSSSTCVGLPPCRARHLLPGVGQRPRLAGHGGHVPHAWRRRPRRPVVRRAARTATRRSPSPCRRKARARSRRACRAVGTSAVRSSCWISVRTFPAGSWTPSTTHRCLSAA